MFPLDVLRVESDAPDQYETSSDGGYTRIRIGDADQTVTGQHTYEIEYRIRGGLNHFSDHDELNYNVTGDQWEVPIERVTATVTLPSGTIDRHRRASRAAPARSCCAPSTRRRAATRHVQQRRPRSRRGHDRRRRLPDGHRRPTPEPILEERWTIAAGVRRCAPTTVAPCRRPARPRGTRRRAAVAWQGRPRPSLRRLSRSTSRSARAASRSRCRRCGGADRPSSSCRPTTCGPVRSARSSTSGPTRSTSPRPSSTSPCAATCASRRSRRRAGSRSDWRLVRLQGDDDGSCEYERDPATTACSPSGDDVRCRPQEHVRHAA